MTQSELNLAVADALGEDRCTIAERGFTLVPAGRRNDETRCLWSTCPECDEPVLLDHFGEGELSPIACCPYCDHVFDVNPESTFAGSPRVVAADRLWCPVGA